MGSPHVAKHRVCSILVKTFIQKGNVDLFLLGEMQHDHGVKAVEDLLKVLAVIVVLFSPTIKESRQFPGESDDFEVIALHGRRGIFTSEHLRNQFVEDVILGPGVGNEMILQEIAGTIETIGQFRRPDISDPCSRRPQVIDMGQEMLVFFVQGGQGGAQIGPPRDH